MYIQNVNCTFLSLESIELKCVYFCMSFFQTYKAIFENIAQTNYVTVIISAICMVILYIVKVHINQRFKHKLKLPVPIELLVVSNY